MNPEAQYWRMPWVSLKSIFFMKHVSALIHPGVSKFILGQRMCKLAIIGPTNAIIYTEPYTSVFYFIVLLEISQALGYIWKALSLLCDDVKVMFPGLTRLEWIWSLRLDCMSKMLSPLFQWNPDYVLKMVASRSTYSSLGEDITLLVFILAGLHACFKHILFGSFGSLFRFGAESSNIRQLLSKVRQRDMQCIMLTCLKTYGTFGRAIHCSSW